ncbi:alpha/beta hydrolase [Actinoplanes sp. NPDC048796]|uniref:alpha/beta fold hydrolase n=1 Tax=Actinoplanes sp. NPDC048796 TaxID=3155640 RepID=UPI0033D391B9
MSAHPEPDPSDARPRLSRRAFTGGAAAATALSLTGAWPSPAGAHTALGPHLPAEFGRTFRSRLVRAGGIRQHVVIGGEGPALLLVHGWPQNWYAWRRLMPALARDHTVIAVDQRGIGLTDKPAGGYDSATLADDLAALMTELGHDRFAVAGHDTGYIIAYALAADHRDRVERLIVAEIPGPPGVVEAPSLFPADVVNNRVWHIPFNRVDDELIVDMVRGNEAAFYGYEFKIQSGGVPLPGYAVDYYTRLYGRSRDSLRASFGLYRAWFTTLTQNVERKKNLLTIPVLGIGGANSWAQRPGDAMRDAATDVRTVVLPGAGHWVAEQAPQPMLAAMTQFLAPYRAARS